MSNNIHRLSKMPDAPETETKTENRVLRVENFIVSGLVALLSLFATYTLNSINTSIHDTAQQVKNIDQNVSEIHVQMAGLSANMTNLTDRVTRDEHSSDSHLRQR